MSRYLVVMPDDSSQPILEAINNASKSLRIKMFAFSDPHLLDAVIAAHRREVKVRIMLNPARRSGEAENEASHKMLTGAGVEVLDSNPAFDLTHEKSMVVDEQTAFVMSLNWESKNFTETRDYAVVTKHGHEVGEVIECFDADWDRKKFAPREPSWRESARSGAPSAQIEEGETSRGSWRHANSGGCRHQGAQAEGAQASCQVAFRRRSPRHHRVHQSRAWELRQPPRARHRGTRP